MRLLFNWKNEVLVSLFLRIFFQKRAWSNFILCIEGSL